MMAPVDRHQEVADVIAGTLWVAGNLYVTGINDEDLAGRRARIVDGIAAILRREYGGKEVPGEALSAGRDPAGALRPE